MQITCATNNRNKTTSNMSKFSLCLVIISGAVQIATSVQHAGYVHKWENDVYVLHCSPIIDNYTFQAVSHTIDDVPYNATRVKITCFAKKIVVRLRFLVLTHVRELTLDTFTVPSDCDKMFRGITGLSKLTLRNLKWSNMTKSTFDGLTQQTSLCWANVGPTFVVTLDQRRTPTLDQRCFAHWAYGGPTVGANH